MTRDPRIDPKPGDKVGFRDKPIRQVVECFTDACGAEWITYTIRKQMPLARWKRVVRHAEVLHASDDGCTGCGAAHPTGCACG